jgi:ribonuclease HI
MLPGMSELDQILAASYKTERAAARRLATGTGISHEQALRQTLEHSAGAAGLAVLLAQRHTLQAADEARRSLRHAQRAQALALRRARHDGAPTAWRAWFDGSAHPNPGACGIGGLLIGPDGEQVEIARAAGHGNSGEAEYRALIAVLEAAVRAGSHPLTIYGDSQVVVNDVNGPDHAAAPSLREYRALARALMARLPGVTLRWIPRHKNRDADALSQRAVGLHEAPIGHAAVERG